MLFKWAAQAHRLFSKLKLCFPQTTKGHCGPAGLLAPFLAGAAVVIPAGGRFSAAAFWKDACKWGVTFYTAVPTIHQVRLHTALTCTYIA